MSLKRPTRNAPAAPVGGGAGGAARPLVPENDCLSNDFPALPPTASQQQGSWALHGGRSCSGELSIHALQFAAAQHFSAHSSAAAAVYEKPKTKSVVLNPAPHALCAYKVRLTPSMSVCTPQIRSSKKTTRKLGRIGRRRGVDRPRSALGSSRGCGA